MKIYIILHKLSYPPEPILYRNKMLYWKAAMKNESSEIIIYQTDDGLVKIDVRMGGDTLWLSLDQMADLFMRDKSSISRHIKNIFAESELIRDSVVANFATTASDGKTYNVDFYCLDLIIAVGYRVRSPRGTLIWQS